MLLVLLKSKTTNAYKCPKMCRYIKSLFKVLGIGIGISEFSLWIKKTTFIWDVLIYFTKQA